jgi:NADP-reducing hydrogenase subunit HndB
MNALVEEINKRGVKNVVVTQTGCIGMCRLEPIVEVLEPGEEKVTYVKMNPEMARKVIVDHIINKNVVTEYTIGASEK